MIRDDKFPDSVAEHTEYESTWIEIRLEYVRRDLCGIRIRNDFEGILCELGLIVDHRIGWIGTIFIHISVKKNVK